LLEGVLELLEGVLEFQERLRRIIVNLGCVQKDVSRPDEKEVLRVGVIG